MIDDDDGGDADSYWSTNIREFKRKKNILSISLEWDLTFQQLFYQKS